MRRRRGAALSLSEYTYGGRTGPFKRKNGPEESFEGSAIPRAHYRGSPPEQTACSCDNPKCMIVIMLWTIAVILLILWLLGFSLHVGGGLIHIILVIVVIVVVIRLVTGRSV